VRSSLLALDVSDPLAVDVSTEKVQTTTSYYDIGTAEIVDFYERM
jgi:hypothetical protein